MAPTGLLLAAILTSAVASADDSPDTATRPNVILIVIDTLRADHLSAYGYGRKTSPNIDRLAAQGVLYEQCISASSWTLPAHASLFTGLYARDHRTTSENWKLDDSFDTLAELLGAAGYHTGGFSNNVWTDDFSNLIQGFDTFLQLWKGWKARGGKNISYDDPKNDMEAARTNQEIFSWLDGLDGKSPEGHRAPFFVFINYYEPHLPYRPTRPYDDDFLPEGVDEGTVRRLRSFYSPREYGYILGVPWMKVSDRDIEILTALYDGEIAYVDSIIGQLVEGLSERGLLEDTLIVITSDHGEHLGENRMLSHKLSVYDPLLRVPMILWNPERIPSGKRIKTQVQAHDVFGSILRLTGVRADATPALPFEERAGDYAFAELAYPGIFLKVIEKQIPGWDASDFARGLQVVRGPRYKLISGSDGSLELYDVIDDPGESRNLAETKPVVLAEMQKALRAFDEGKLPAAEAR